MLQLLEYKELILPIDKLELRVKTNYIKAYHLELWSAKKPYNEKGFKYSQDLPFNFTTTLAKMQFFGDIQELWSRKIDFPHYSVEEIMDQLNSANRHHHWRNRPNHLKIIMRDAGEDYNKYKKPKPPKVEEAPKNETVDE